MKLHRKGEHHKDGDKKDGSDKAPDAVHMPWDAALAGLGSGAYDLAGYNKDDRVADLAAAQSPAPGTDPVDGEEKVVDGHVLTNMVDVAGAVASPGLAASPPEMKVVEAPKPAVAAPAPAPLAPPAPAAKPAPAPAKA